MNTLNQPTSPVNTTEANENRSTIRRAIKDREHPYFRVRRSMAQDKNLSFEARGLLLYLLSKSDDWTALNSDLLEAGKIGMHVLKRVLRELQSAGYLSRKRIRLPDGTFIWERIYYEASDGNPEFQSIQPQVENLPVVESAQTQVDSRVEEPRVEEPRVVNQPSYKEQSLQKTELQNKDLQKTHIQTDLRAVGAPAVAVCGGSKFSLAECRKYAEHLHTTGQGINNPGGFSRTIYNSGQADDEIEAFLSRTPEQVEEIRTTPANQNLFFGEAVQLLQAMMAVGREPQAIIDDMPLDDDTRRRLIEKFIEAQPHGLKAPDNLRNTPGPELKQASVSALNQAAV
jgi:hypothetical protein